MSGVPDGYPWRCTWCCAELAEHLVYDYSGEKAHTVWPPDPYFSSESAGLPCGPVVANVPAVSA